MDGVTECVEDDHALLGSAIAFYRINSCASTQIQCWACLIVGELDCGF